MKLYNVLSQDLETFAPGRKAVTIYVCGITPYDTTHLGHAFTYTVFDVLIRYLEYRGHSVRYVQNVTDIDDDILRKAGEVGEDWRALGNRWTAHFIRDMQSLNVRPPDHFPGATDVIPEIIDIVSQLLEARVAYEAGGNVYFHVDSWPEFGRLSRIARAEMLPVANERGNRPDDPHKQDPLDFVLWQAQAPGEPAWDSPWGAGRPGWHIECSTMATSLLGDTIDIHGGGRDLIFPHHECEIAQAEGATGNHPFVRFWMHAAMVHHDGEKMSKSLGNLIMVRDLLQDWSPDMIRLYLAGHHYREPWSFDDRTLAKAGQLARRLEEAASVESGQDSPLVGLTSIEGAFVEAMDKDLGTPEALAELGQLAERIIAAAREDRNVKEAQQTLRRMGQIFGLRLDRSEPEARVVSRWNEHLARFADK